MKNAESSRILRMRILSAHTVNVFAYEQCRKNAWIKRLTSVCGCGKITVVILAGGAKAYMKLKGKHRMSIWRYLALGYLFVIMLGSVLLVLPFAAQEGQTTSYINALFTSASATCVTGLAPYDTNTHWSMFGKAVILILIQTGGLGFMTFVSVLLMMFRRGLGLYERKVVMQSYGGQLSGIKGLVKRIVIGSLACEFVGALLLSIRFIGDFGWGTGCWYAVWHSVSAFCNAGFDLMAGTHGGHLLSLGYYATDPLVSLTICGLIIIGGIGFCVWEDVISCRGNIKKFHFYTKLILFANTLLLAFSTVLYMIFEWNNVSYSDYHFGQKLLCSFFNASTTRTAGFTTTDPRTFSESGYLLNVILMFIGGSSGSTAGGIKVSTFVILIMGMLAALGGSRDINVGKRRIEFTTVRQAFAIFIAYLSIILVAVMTICAFEPGLTFKEVLFECVSALGTVGQSLALTPRLGTAAKLIIIVMMYAGRVGIITLVLALRTRKKEAQVRNPVETPFVG